MTGGIAEASIVGRAFIVCSALVEAGLDPDSCANFGFAVRPRPRSHPWEKPFHQTMIRQLP
jgi:hypothetical protein